MYTNLLRKISDVRNDISSLKTIIELLEYIPNSSLIKLSEIILFIWMSTPIFILIRGFMFSGDENLSNFYIHTQLSIYWYTLLQQLGLLGCFITLLIFSKSIITIKNDSIINYLRNNSFILLLLSILVWSFLSMLASDNIFLSLFGDKYRHDGFIAYLAYAGIFGCAYFIQDVNRVVKLLIYFTSISTILSILVLLNNENINSCFKLHRLSAVFVNINHYGYYIILSIMCLVVLVIMNGIKKSNKIIYSFFYFLQISSLIKNGSFGPYVAVFIGFISIIFILRFFNPLNKKRIYMLFTTFIIISIIFNFQTNYLSMELDRLGNDLTQINEDSDSAGKAGSGRWKLWVNGVRFILEKPIFGYGPDNLGNRYSLEKISNDRPHNEFIQLAASVGIPALFLYISAMILHFRKLLIYKEKMTSFSIGLYLVIFTYLVSSFFGNTMYYTTPYFYMLLGISGGVIKQIECKSV